MPALNFSLFLDKVIDGTKPHTIRAERKIPIKVGDDLSFFTGMRTKSCRRLRPNTACTAAVAITIHPNLQIELGEGSRFYPAGFLNAKQTEQLARRDGFADLTAFYLYFFRDHAFPGQLIEWSSNASDQPREPSQ